MTARTPTELDIRAQARSPESCATTCKVVVPIHDSNDDLPDTAITPLHKCAITLSVPVEVGVG